MFRIKTLICFALLSIIACRKDSPEPVYTNLSGNWIFQGKAVSGDLTISGASDKLSVTAGHFILQGKPHVVTKSYQVDDAVDLEEASDIYLIFHSLNVAPDYKTFTSYKYSYPDNGAQWDVQDVITFKRK